MVLKTKVSRKISVAVLSALVLTVGFGCGKPRSTAEADTNGMWKMKGAYFPFLLSRLPLPIRGVVVRLQLQGSDALISAVSPDDSTGTPPAVRGQRKEANRLEFAGYRIASLTLKGVENGVLYASGKFDGRDVDFEFEKDSSGVTLREVPVTAASGWTIPSGALPADPSDPASGSTLPPVPSSSDLPPPPAAADPKPIRE